MNFIGLGSLSLILESLQQVAVPPVCAEVYQPADCAKMYKNEESVPNLINPIKLYQTVSNRTKLDQIVPK